MSYTVSFGIFVLLRKPWGSSLTLQKLDLLDLTDSFANFLNLRRELGKGADFFALQNLKCFCTLALHCTRYIRLPVL